ncbi:hypothetical protein WQE_35560 [Paraburkholderia hospita]|uniref:Uncharacterized protein n=1 Tax=Paraburkholderia hospita TaxID=169430 RepID=A0ABN0FBX8_9BURK|nr:hypothetical protein WQE_35560 [Paraburkholderia hospita]OUL67920.1 hypothetical protein CA602_52120 [Paraburkholderia hospita]
MVFSFENLAQTEHRLKREANWIPEDARNSDAGACDSSRLKSQNICSGEMRRRATCGQGKISCLFRMSCSRNKRSVIETLQIRTSVDSSHFVFAAPVAYGRTLAMEGAA